MNKNFVYVNEGTYYGNPTGQIGPVMQGMIDLPLIIEVRDYNNDVINLTGATSLGGKMIHRGTRAVTALDGPVTVSAGNLVWTGSVNDFGTDGVYYIWFSYTLSGVSYVTLPSILPIVENPGVTAVASEEALDANMIRGLTVATTAPSNLNALIWNSTTLQWEPKIVSKVAYTIASGASPSPLNINFNATWSFREVTLTYTPITVTFSNKAAGRWMDVLFIQDGVGSRVVGTWPATVIWIPGGNPPTFTTQPGKRDLVSFMVLSDGSSVLGVHGGNDVA